MAALLAAGAPAAAGSPLRAAAELAAAPLGPRLLAAAAGGCAAEELAAAPLTAGAPLRAARWLPALPPTALPLTAGKAVVPPVELAALALAAAALAAAAPGSGCSSRADILVGEWAMAGLGGELPAAAGLLRGWAEAEETARLEVVPSRRRRLLLCSAPACASAWLLGAKPPRLGPVARLAADLLAAGRALGTPRPLVEWGEAPVLAADGLPAECAARLAGWLAEPEACAAGRPCAGL